MSFLHFPKPGTVRGRDLGALLRGEHLTLQDSLRRSSDFHLAAHIEVLGKGRMEHIDTELIDVGTRDAGSHSEVARYLMRAEAIAEAGDVGLQFVDAAHLAEIERRAA